MPGSRANSLDSLSSPSLSPSPPPASKSASTNAHINSPGNPKKKAKAVSPAAGPALGDSDSELSELTEEEDEKQKGKMKGKGKGRMAHTLKEKEKEKKVTGAAQSGVTSPGGPSTSRRRKKRSTLVPAPMWGWAATAAAAEPNPLDVLTSVALDGEETEEESNSNTNTSRRQVAIANRPSASSASSIASSRVRTPHNEEEDEEDSIASSRPSPPPAKEDEDPPRAKPKPNLRIDASAQLPPTSSVPLRSATTVPTSVKSPNTPTSAAGTVLTNASSRAKPRGGSRGGGRGRGRGRGRARTRGIGRNHTVDVEPDTENTDAIDELANAAAAAAATTTTTTATTITNGFTKDDRTGITMDTDDAPIPVPVALTSASTSASADNDHSDVEPELESALSLAPIPPVIPESRSEVPTGPKPSVKVEPEVQPPSDASDGEEEDMDVDMDLDEGEGEDEKEDVDVDAASDVDVDIEEDKEDEVEVDEDKEDEDKEDDDEQERSEIEDEDVDLDQADGEDPLRNPDPDADEEDDLEDPELHEPAHRVEALEVLAMIELKFALLREKVYLEKMDELAWEEGLLLGNGTGGGIHPELQHIQSELLLRKNRRLELAERKCAFECENVRKRRRVDEVDVWSTWKLQRETLQTDMIAENNRKRRKLERERRAADRPGITRRIPLPPASDFYLPAAPSFMEVVDSYSMNFGAPPGFLGALNAGNGTGFPFGPNGRKTQRANGHNGTRKSIRNKSAKLQVNGVGGRGSTRGTNGKVNGHSSAPPSSSFIVAYPELATLSSAEAQADLEALFVLGGFSGSISGGVAGGGAMGVMGVNSMGMGGGRRAVGTLGISGSSGSQGMNGINMNGERMNGIERMSNMNMGIGYDQPQPGIGSHPNRDNRAHLGSFSTPGHSGPGLGQARRIVSGPGPSTPSALSLGAAGDSGFEPQPRHEGGSGGSVSAPSFGPGGPNGRLVSMGSARPGSSVGGASGNSRSSFQVEQREHDGDVMLGGAPPPSSSSLVHHHAPLSSNVNTSIHGRQVSSSAYFGPSGSVGPSSATPIPPPRRSLSPVSASAGPSIAIGVGVGPNGLGVKGNGQWMGPGMGMGGFGSGSGSHNRWEENDQERERKRERERMGYKDGGREHERDREERERERNSDRDPHSHILHQRHIRPEQPPSNSSGSTVRPKSATMDNRSGPLPPHLHSHSSSHPIQPSQSHSHSQNTGLPHHHHHIRPHHHHVVHHHHPHPIAGGASISPTGSNASGPSHSPRMTRRDPNGTVPSAPSSSNRMKDDMSIDYRERDARRMSGGHRPSGPLGLDERDRERARERERDRERDDRRMSTGMSFSSGPRSLESQRNATTSMSSPRPSSWNAVERVGDDPYRPESMHSSSHRTSFTSTTSPNHPRGIGSGALPPTRPGSSSATISPPRTRTLPPRPASPAAAIVSSSNGSSAGSLSGPSNGRMLMRSPGRYSDRERSPNNKPRVLSPPPPSSSAVPAASLSKQSGSLSTVSLIAMAAPSTGPDANAILKNGGSFSSTSNPDSNIPVPVPLPVSLSATEASSAKGDVVDGRQ